MGNVIFSYNNGVLSSHNVNSNQYNGDKTGGEFRAWKTFGPDPNEFVRCSYGVLTERCATLYHTSAIARACVNKPLTYAIGDGLLFKSSVDNKRLGMGAEEAVDWSREFTSLLHDEKMEANYYEKQALIFREAKICGDSLLYFLRDDKEQDIPFDLLAATGSDINWQKTGKNIKLGVKTDTFNRRIGIYRDGRKGLIPFKDKNKYQNVIQFMFKERPGQIRGLSAYYSEIGHAKNLDRAWDATIERVVQEATQLGYFNASDTNVSAQALAMQARGEGATRTDTVSEITRSEEMKTGGMYWLKNKEGMNFTDLKTPSNNFGMFNEWTIKMFCMATGYPPEFILGEYSTSYTAHRGALNDAIKRFMQERSTFIRLVDSVVNFEYLKWFIMTGQIAEPKNFWTDRRVRREALAGSTLGPVPGHVNPFQEVKADIAAVEAGFTLRSIIAAKSGNDWHNQVDEWAKQEDRWYNGSAQMRADTLAADMIAEGNKNAEENKA